MLVERHFIKGTEEIRRLCGLSKDLYNRCNYLMRQAWFQHERLPGIVELVASVEHEECYLSLHNTKTAKQTIRKVLVDWTNYKKALATYQRDSSKFIKRPKPPGYKEKMAQVIFYPETIRRKPLKKGIVTPTNDCFTIKSSRVFRQVVITPKTFGFVIDVSYDSPVSEKHELDKKHVCCIDIGLNNLAAITSDQHCPILINGRIVKGINQWYNKRPDSARRSRKRYFRLENYFHHASKWIVQNCLANDIGTIVIGRNEGWKNGIECGRKTNQAFCMVPHYLFLQKLKYKAEAVGIDVILTEEAYTSKASYLDRDPIPSYQKGVEEPVRSGQRVKRGLYRSASGVMLNADCNGACNIGRKVIRNEEILLRLDRGLAERPVVVNPLRTPTDDGRGWVTTQTGK